MHNTDINLWEIGCLLSRVLKWGRRGWEEEDYALFCIGKPILGHGCNGRGETESRCKGFPEL